MKRCCDHECVWMILMFSGTILLSASCNEGDLVKIEKGIKEVGDQIQKAPETLEEKQKEMALWKEINQRIEVRCPERLESSLANKRQKDLYVSFTIFNRSDLQ